MRLFPAQPPPNRLQISVRSCEIHTNTDACVRRLQHPEAAKQNQIFQYLENHGKCGCFHEGTTSFVTRCRALVRRGGGESGGRLCRREHDKGYADDREDDKPHKNPTRWFANWKAIV